MKVRVVNHEGGPVFNFGNSGPWFEFKRVFLESGFQLLESEFGSKIEGLVSNTFSRKALKEADKSALPMSKRVLVMWEPKVVMGRKFGSRNLKKFGKIFSPSLDWLGEFHGSLFYWPQHFPINNTFHVTDWSSRKHNIVLIQGNKFSAHKGEKYSFRQDLMLSLAKSKISANILLFGNAWNRGVFYDLRSWMISATRVPLHKIDFRSAKNIGQKYSFYRGPCADKLDLLQQYKFSLVIENSSDYVSEKIFDSVLANCLTFYLGPDLSSLGISFPTLTILSPDIQESLKKIESVITLPLQEQFDLQQAQFAALQSLKRQCTGNNSLSNLARDIINHLKS
jgi:hypothetical protein